MILPHNRIKHKKEEYKAMSLRHTLLSTVLLVSGTLGVIGLRPTLPVSAAGGYQTKGIPYLLPSHFPPQSSTLHLPCGASTLSRIACDPSIRVPTALR
jgi:hypothetical protein